MHDQATACAGVDDETAVDVRAQMREEERSLALRSALQKRSSGVPTYTIPETAALLSVSREHLYRLVRADSFPVVRMATEGGQGRYVIPALAVEQLLTAAVESGRCTDAGTWTADWQPVGGAR